MISPSQLESCLIRHIAHVLQLIDEIPPSRAGHLVAEKLLDLGHSGVAEPTAEFDPETVRSRLLRDLRETRRWLLVIREIPLIQPQVRVDEILRENQRLTELLQHGPVRVAA